MFKESTIPHLLLHRNRDVLSTIGVLAQLTVTHLCGLPAQGINNKANNASSASPAHLRFIISTDVQILFVCQLTCLCQYVLRIFHLSSQLIYSSQTLANTKTSAHILHALTNATSAKTLNLPERNLFCAKPAKTHAQHWYLQILFNIQRVGGDFFKTCSKNKIVQCPYAGLSTVFCTHKSKRTAKCTTKQE